jgi:hypothetical protein
MKFNNLAPHHYEMVHYTFCALARALQTGIFIAQNAKKPAPECRALSLSFTLHRVTPTPVASEWLGA